MALQVAKQQSWLETGQTPQWRPTSVGVLALRMSLKQLTMSAGRCDSSVYARADNLSVEWNCVIEAELSQRPT
jgi:hypothetical protein